jgi:hypothetical protein
MCTGNSPTAVATSAQSAIKTAAGSSPTLGGKLSTGLKMANAFVQPIAKAALGLSRPMTFDPDLEQAYKKTHRGNGSRAAYVDVDGRKQIVAEQKRRDDLRAQNAALAEQRRAEEAKVAEGWKQARVQQEAEFARQGEMKQQFERDQAAQQVQIAGTRAASQAVSQSLQILSSQNGKQAPTAAVAKRKGQQAGPRTAAAALRMGSISSGSGAGPNLPV